MELKKVRVRKELGTWYYSSYKEHDCEFKIYKLYDENKKPVLEFASYGTMIEYIETGIVY